MERFKRVAAALDDDARARLCMQGSGNGSTDTDLSDLVDSFFDGGKSCVAGDYVQESDQYYQNLESFSGTKEMLIDLISDEDDPAKLAIRVEVELACRGFENSSSEGFKRRLMTILRQRGFDAGLCKSRREKTGRLLAEEFEYIDVLISGNRYIVEVLIGSEFTIARPTKTFQSLLEILPKITVIKPNVLKKLVRLMCNAMRASLKTRNMLVSPWRKNGYMQTKWLGSYKRTMNPALPATPYSGAEFNGKIFLGFEYSPPEVGGKNNYCRKEVGRMHVVGNLKALMLSGMS